MERTTIEVKKDTKIELEKFKIHRNESFDEMFWRCFIKKRRSSTDE